MYCNILVTGQNFDYTLNSRLWHLCNSEHSLRYYWVRWDMCDMREFFFRWKMWETKCSLLISLLLEKQFKYYRDLICFTFLWKSCTIRWKKRSHFISASGVLIPKHYRDHSLLWCGTVRLVPILQENLEAKDLLHFQWPYWLDWCQVFLNGQTLH